MTSKILFLFIFILMMRAYGYSQIKNVKHHQLPAYVNYDTLVVNDVWVQTAKSEAEQIKKIKTLEAKIERVTIMLHQKKHLSEKALQTLAEIDSLKAQNEALKLKINKEYKGEFKSLKKRIISLNDRVVLQQVQINNLKKARRKLRGYSIGATVTSGLFLFLLLII